MSRTDKSPKRLSVKLPDPPAWSNLEMVKFYVHTYKPEPNDILISQGIQLLVFKGEEQYEIRIISLN